VWRDRESERQRDRETERQRDRATERQRDREAEGQTEGQQDRQKNRETEGITYLSGSLIISTIQLFLPLNILGSSRLEIILFKSVQIDLHLANHGR